MGVVHFRTLVKLTLTLTVTRRMYAIILTILFLGTDLFGQNDLSRDETGPRHFKRTAPISYAPC